MKCNGYDSEDYLYFRLNEEIEVIGNGGVFDYVNPGNVYRLPKNKLKYYLYSSEFLNKYSDCFEEYDFIYDNQSSFNIMDLIYIQKPFIVKEDSILKLRFHYNGYCLINKWLKNKMESEESCIKSIFTQRSIKEQNDYVFSDVEEREIISLNTTKILPALINKNNSLAKFVSMYKFIKDTPIHIIVKKGEQLDLTNPSLALAFLDQNFLMFIGHSEEITNEEKEQLFYKEYNNYIPGTRIKYYKVKDNVKINDPRDFLTREFPSSFGTDYRPHILDYSEKRICKRNPLNFNEDGSVKYFYIEYRDSILNIAAEEELAKIATPLSREEAIEKYKEDIIAEEKYRLEQEAQEYVRTHKARYNKGANRLLTPIEFMEREQQRERKELGMRLVKTLRKRMTDLNN